MKSGEHIRKTEGRKKMPAHLSCQAKTKCVHAYRHRNVYTASGFLFVHRLVSGENHTICALTSSYLTADINHGATASN